MSRRLLKKLFKKKKDAPAFDPMFITGIGKDRVIRPGCKVKIYALSGSFLLSGAVIQIQDKAIEIQADLDHMNPDLMAFHDHVHIRGSDLADQEFCLSGSLSFLKDKIFVIKNLVVCDQKDSRSTDRLFVLHPCTLYEFDAGWHDILKQDQCFLLDISVGGACVESKLECDKGAFVRLYLKFPECKPFGVYGRIIRVTKVSNFGLSLYRYGLEFFLNDHTESEKLQRNLNQIKIVSRKLKI